jgi:hypothetical protein
MRYVHLNLSTIGLFAALMAFPLDLRAQGGSSAADSMRAWRHTSRGLSSNAGLAFHRLRSAGHSRLPATPRWKQPLASRGTIYSAPYYAITTPWAIPNLRSDPYPAVSSPSTRKPFAGARPAPTAVDRYWPLLFEAREDPKTGLVIWSLP